MKTMKSPLMHSDFENNAKFTWFLFCCFMFPAFGGVLFGFDIGSTGVINLTLSKDFTALEHYAVMGAYTSSSLVGAFVSALVAMQIGDDLGRRRMMLYGGVFYLIGSTVSALAPNLVVVLIGKLIFGIGIGTSMHSCPVYISEMSPARFRGLLVSLKAALIVVGMGVGNLSGWFFAQDHGWRYIFATAGGLSIVYLIGVFLLPPSARWLASREIRTIGVVTEDTKALMRQSQGLSVDGIEQEVDAIIETLDFDPMLPTNSLRRSSVTSTCSVASVQQARAPVAQSPKISLAPPAGNLWRSQRQLLVGIGLVVLQQITGQPAVLYYISSMLKAPHDSIGTTALKAAYVSSAKLVATALSAVLVRRLGRRTLLRVGVIGMGAITAALAFVFYRDPDAHFAVIALLMGFVAFYQFGFGNIVWLLISEIFPQKIRSRAVGVTVSINFATNLVMNFSLSVIMHHTSMTFTYGMFAVFCLFSIAFITLLVPETKDKTLEQIERIFYPNRLSTFDSMSESL